MKFPEQQQGETKQAKEEAHRLKSKMKTMQQIELLLQSEQSEMIRDVGVEMEEMIEVSGGAASCVRVSFKKKYETLKEARKA